jgi:hypothetical protein
MGQTVNQACYVEILKWLPKVTCRKWLECWANNLAPANKALSVKQFLAQKSITTMGHPPYSHDPALNGIWLLPNALKG